MPEEGERERERDRDTEREGVGMIRIRRHTIITKDSTAVGIGIAISIASTARRDLADAIGWVAFGLCALAADVDVECRLVVGEDAGKVLLILGGIAVGVGQVVRIAGGTSVCAWERCRK
jgi:hypothetical protein